MAEARCTRRFRDLSGHHAKRDEATGTHDDAPEQRPRRGDLPFRFSPKHQQATQERDKENRPGADDGPPGEIMIRKVEWRTSLSLANDFGCACDCDRHERASPHDVADDVGIGDDRNPAVLSVASRRRRRIGHSFSVDGRELRCLPQCLVS